VLVGWGAQPYLSELGPDGSVRFDAYFGHGKPPGEDADTYRAYRFVWHGRPTDRPALAVGGGTAYASWNGATEVRRWLVLAGPDAQHLQKVAEAARSGFETPIRVSKSAAVYAVRAIGNNGKVLGTSRAVKANS
jgi:hypothetical protein